MSAVSSFSPTWTGRKTGWPSTTCGSSRYRAGASASGAAKGGKKTAEGTKSVVDKGIEFVKEHPKAILIAGALGEIYETSDMYPNFIKVAIDEGNKKAEMVFTRAKLAEAVHAELYMDAYNNIDAPTDEAYYLCPICGYIHKGDDFEKCPICFTPADKFRKFHLGDDEFP